MSIGFTLPFMRATGSLGYFEMTSSDIEATKNNIRSILLTNWGERLMHYSFGCNFREFLFENMDSVELKDAIADRVISQMSTWLPFVTIENLNVLLSEDDSSLPEHVIGIKIRFKMSNGQRLSSIEVFAPLG